MRNLRVINKFDFGRSLGPRPSEATPQSVAAFLVDEIALKAGGQFTYDAAGNAAVDGVRGRQTAQGAEDYCRKNAQPAGRMQNVYAIRASFPYFASFNCDADWLQPVAMHYATHRGCELFLGLKIPVFARKPRAPALLTPQFRRLFAPTLEQLAPAIALANRARELGAYDAGDPILVWAHPLDGTQERGLRVLTARDLPKCDDSQLDHYLNIFADGVRLALDRDLSWGEGSLKGFRIFDPDQPSML